MSSDFGRRCAQLRRLFHASRGSAFVRRCAQSACRPVHSRVAITKCSPNCPLASTLPMSRRGSWPKNRVDVAIPLAQFYIRQSRSASGDLRYLGYAQAVLATLGDTRATPA